MPIVSVEGKPSVSTNVFWIAANILFDLETGATKQVLLLVNTADDATVFTETDAQNYLNFVATRAKNISWSVERLTTGHNLQRLGRFVIKGVQHV